METIEADMNDDFFGATAGEGPPTSFVSKKASQKPFSSQPSSSATRKSVASQPSSLSKRTNGSQAAKDGEKKEEVRKDIKGKGKATITDKDTRDEASRIKGAKPHPMALSSAPSTSTKQLTTSSTKSKAKETDARSTVSQKSGPRKVKKDPAPFPMPPSPAPVDAESSSRPLGPSYVKKSKNRRGPKEDSGSDDELRLKASPSPTDKRSKKSPAAIPSPSARPPHAESSAQASARANEETPKPKGRSALISGARNRLHSKNYLPSRTTDSPDPLNISPLNGNANRHPRPRNRHDALLELSTAFVRTQPKKTILVPSSSMSSAEGNRPPSKKIRRVGQNASDDESTPRPVKSKGPPRAPIDDQGASAFFAAMDSKTAEEREREAKLVSQHQQIEFILSSQETGAETLQREMEDDADGFNEFTPEELEYCAGFSEPSNPCRYCGLPMPKDPSAGLVALGFELVEAEEDLPPGEQLDWTLFDPYCRRHEAETTTIPLGIRAGFPAEIDFDNLRDILERPYIRSRLESLCSDPTTSTFYNDTIDAIRKMGHTQWQVNEKILAASFPGYYGDIGLNILMDHFLLLRKWKLLAIPGLLKKDPHNFIQTVLVPESAVMLIMVDRGWTGDPMIATEAREEAMKIRADSWKYGHAAFPETSQGEHNRADDKAWVIKSHRIRGLPVPRRRKKKRSTPEKQGGTKQVIEVSSDTAQSHASDSSAYSESSQQSGQEDEDESTDADDNVPPGSTAKSDIVSTPPLEALLTLGAMDNDGRLGRAGPDADDVDPDSTLKMASQGSSMFDDGLDEDMIAAADAVERRHKA